MINIWTGSISSSNRVLNIWICNILRCNHTIHIWTRRLVVKASCKSSFVVPTAGLISLRQGRNVMKRHVLSECVGQRRSVFVTHAPVSPAQICHFSCSRANLGAASDQIQCHAPVKAFFSAMPVSISCKLAILRQEDSNKSTFLGGDAVKAHDSDFIVCVNNHTQVFRIAQKQRETERDRERQWETERNRERLRVTERETVGD